MGRDKATLPFHGETLLKRAVRLVRRAVDDVVVVARPGQSLPSLPSSARVVRDDVEDRGPLGGLSPGLRASKADAALAVACDSPFLHEAAIDFVFARLGDAEVAIVVEDGRPCPLFAVYRTSLAPRIDRMLAEGRLRPVFLLDEVPHVRIDAEELRAADCDLRSLVNCNTPEAYESALAASGPWVRVEFYDVARLRAGTAAIEVEAATLGDALREAAERLPALVPDVIRDGRLLEHWRANIDGERFVDDPELPLRSGSAVLLLSAQAGG
ncbi:MAG: molybdenum cofactor guanylyltransferase [Planctomycetes bacterium]|nr:molybdenum cofactor guanylyltransferase [Planctomycetota bacterium]